LSFAVNRSSKLFIAAALLAAGYGVASLLGSPSVPYLSQASRSEAREEFGAQLTPQADDVRRVVRPDFGVRLLPNAEAVSRLPAVEDSSRRGRMEISPSTGPTNQAVATFAHEVNKPVESIKPADNAPSSPSTEHSLATDSLRSGPRATLKDVAPRPLRTDDEAELLTTQPSRRARDRLAENSAQQINVAAPARAVDANVVTSNYLATGAPPITLSGPAADFAPQHPMSPQSFSATLKPSTNPPRPELTGVLRVHTVVDGDSLPKLAARYLRDAKRSSEIFTLNRDVLKSPDLLPIGIELKIPASQASVRGG
jgi:nucleoid-associated protein YgaU